MAITDKEKGVWGLDQVYNKINQGSIWTYSGSSDEDGTLWSWGWGGSGRLGLNGEGAPASRSSPTQIGTGDTWSNLGTDGRTLSKNGCLKSDGTLWVWGENNFGQLGQNSKTYYSSPVQLAGSWKNFGCSSSVFAAINTSGELWVVGRNNEGQLGDNSEVHKSSPVQIPGTTWSSVTCAYPYLSATKTDGTMWAWGNNVAGQLGQNNEVKYSSPVQIPGTSWAFTTVSEKNIWATKTNGELWAIGGNDYGELGQNNTTQYSSPVQIPGTWAVEQNKLGGGYTWFFGIKSNETLWFLGNGGGAYGYASGLGSQTQYSSPAQVPGTTWKEVAAGTSGNVAVKTDGTLWTWGSNSYGELGQNNRTHSNSPVQVPGSWATKHAVSAEWNGVVARKQP